MLYLLLVALMPQQQMDVMQIVSRLVEIVGAASLFSAVEDNYRLELVHITSPSPRIRPCLRMHLYRLSKL